MSGCDRVQSLLSALVDGELSSAESREVDNHLLSCRDCQQELDSLLDIHNRLSRVLTIGSADLKCAEIMALAPRSPQHVNALGSSWHFVAGVVAIAAILLFALLPFFVEKTSRTPGPSLEFVAQIVRATGPVQFLRPGANDWSEVLPNAKESLTAGSRLRTDAGVLCEVQTATRGMIRMNESAEVVFMEANQVELINGQLWCLAPEATDISVAMPEVHTQSPLSLIFACPSSTEIQCKAGNSFASCDSVSPDNEVATMTLGSISCSVAPGESVSIDTNHQIDRRLNVDSAAKIWQLPLLALGTEVDSELLSLLDRVLAPIGMTKARSMNEEQIRMLGPRGAIPLLAYVVAETSPESLQLRRKAIRLAADQADDRGVRLLKVLTTDSDEYIARVAKETLNRIVPPSSE